VFDLLDEHPACELPFHAYLEMLSLLAPRYYSISSSPSGDPARCSITTAVVEGPASSGRGVFRGVCSNYLAGRRAGDTIHASVRETKAGFRLPDDCSVPIIMIGPGTGSRRSAAFCRSVRRARPRAQRSDPRYCFRLPASRTGFSLCRRAEAFAADAYASSIRRSRVSMGKRPTCSTWSRTKRTRSGA